VRKTLRRRLVASAFAVAFGVGLSTVVADPAAAAVCTLFIGQQTPQHFYATSVSCDGVLQPSYSLWGEDEIFDEFRHTVINFAGSVPRSVLNEDDSWFNREDDIYAMVNGNKTNVIHREF